MKRVQLIVLLAGIILTVGCASSTRVTSTWKAPEATVQPYKKIAVVGIIREADRTLRERMEQKLAAELKTLGYNAFSAYATYGPKEFEGLNEEQVNKHLKDEGVDAVMTVVLLDKEKERDYVPGRFVNTPYFTRHNLFWGYYSSLNYRIGSPGYYDVQTRYFWESNLYDLNKQQLVFSVQTQSFDPATKESLADDYGQKIIQSMVDKGVLHRNAGAVASGY